ncbi:uncharacterized protein YecE (DUF72 family) [Pedobacter cryoconitis]|uniref:Uncharacterized protein YecE (DUF72 family) n=1 Tax=Pedobacter cryoconitis TaxID=188932 RepID=A0A7W8ZP99_9SPHI|nr:DUF72 domain-containing protein [Pedobacter cryoconitis]MBB5637528.1 uncharacterized protein YecE (DUF72 family) [Pedobacter cryoconitis]
MEFGKVSSENVKDVDFTLPADGEQTQWVLDSANAGKAKVFIGCAKWGRKEWVGLIYPPKTKEADFLNEYAKHFNAIELNAVYYQIPSVESVRKWKKQASDNAPGDFLFCPKFPKVITHDQRLVGAEQATIEYFKIMSEFGENLGPCFLQLSESFGVKSKAVLEDYIKALPKEYKVFVELRHEQWFADPVTRQHIFQLFRETNKGAVITDVSGRRDLMHMEVTIPEVFIRFIGNGHAHKKSDFARIDEWGARLKLWQENGLQKIYFFLHQHDELDTPLLATYAIKVFNEQLGINLPEISFQPRLFD